MPIYSMKLFNTIDNSSTLVAKQLEPLVSPWDVVWTNQLGGAAQRGWNLYELIRYILKHRADNDWYRENEVQV